MDTAAIGLQSRLSSGRTLNGSLEVTDASRPAARATGADGASVQVDSRGMAFMDLESPVFGGQMSHAGSFAKERSVPNPTGDTEEMPEVPPMQAALLRLKVPLTQSQCCLLTSTLPTMFENPGTVQGWGVDYGDRHVQGAPVVGDGVEFVVTNTVAESQSFGEPVVCRGFRPQVNDSVSVRLEDSFRSLPHNDSVSVRLETEFPPEPPPLQVSSKTAETAAHVQSAANAALAAVGGSSSSRVAAGGDGFMEGSESIDGVAPRQDSTLSVEAQAGSCAALCDVRLPAANTGSTGTDAFVTASVPP